MTTVIVHRALGRGGQFRPVVVTVDGRAEETATRKQPATFDLPPGRHRFKARFGFHQSNTLTVDVGDKPVSLVVRLADVPDLQAAREPLLIEQSDDLTSGGGTNLLHRAPAGGGTLALGAILLVIGIFDLVVATEHPNQTVRWVIGMLALLSATWSLLRWILRRRRPAR